MALSAVFRACALVLLAGCEVPSSLGSTDTEGTSEGSGTTVVTTSSTTSMSSTTTTTEDTTTEDTRTEDTAVESTSSGTTGSGTGTDGCACGMQEVGVDEPGPDGVTFEELVAGLGAPEVAWEWNAVMGQPTTTVHFELEIEGPAVLASDGGCGDPACNYLSGRVRLLVTSDDGLLAEDVEAGVWGVLGEQVYIDNTADALDTFMGTLPMQTFVDENGDPIAIDSAGIGGEWTWEDDAIATSFRVYSPGVMMPNLVIGRSTD